jgi:D-glucuronyl C5-epimerase C-terminus
MANSISLNALSLAGLVLVFTLIISPTETGIAQTYAPDQACKNVIVSPTHRFVVDSNGLLLVDYGGNVGVVYNPVALEERALKYYEEFITEGNASAKLFLLHAAQWLIDHASDRGNYSLWEYSFPWPYYACLSPPYASGIAQALGMEVLMLAHKITQNSKYIEAAKKSFGAFLIDYNEGGIATKTKDDSLIFQELAKSTYPETDIFNGHMLALISLLKYYKYTNDSVVNDVATKGINYLKNYIHTYDASSWSYFDHTHIYANENYHLIHIDLLQILYKMTHEPIFDQYAKKFINYYLKAHKTYDSLDPRFEHYYLSR